MGVIGDTLSSFTVPTAGSTAGPTYASQISSLLTELKARCAAKLGVASLAIDGALAMGGYALSAVKNVIFTAQATNPTDSNSVWFNSVDKELYCKTGDGNVIKMTEGSGMNYSATGGFDGDYAGDANVSAKYTTSTTLFELLSNASSTIYAKLATAAHRIYEAGAGANYVEITAPSISANVTRTLLGTNPVNDTYNNMLKVSSTGAESTTQSPSFDTLTGVAVVGSTSVQTAGADILHADRIIHFGTVPGKIGANFTYTPRSTTTGAYFTPSAYSGYVDFELPVDVGQTIKACGVYIKGNTNDTASVTLFETDITTGVSAEVAGCTVQTKDADANIDLVGWSGKAIVAEVGHIYEIRVTAGSTDYNIRVYGGYVTVNRS